MAQVIDHMGPFPKNYPAGVIGAMRYIAPRRSDGSRRPKCITPEELSWLLTHGKSVGFVFEDNVGNALRGAAQGTKDGRIAVAEAIRLKLPSGVALYAAVDTDITTQMAAVRAYLTAFAAEVKAEGYRMGVYGEYDVVTAFATRERIATLGWQTVAWSGKKKAQGQWGINLYQRAGQITIDGTLCDLNDIWYDDWGQMGPIATPVPNPPAKEITVPLTGAKSVTAVVPALSGEGHYRLHADGAISTVGAIPMFGSIYSLPPEKRQLAPGEIFIGLVVHADHFILVTNEGDEYKIGA